MSGSEPFIGYDANVAAGLPPDGDVGEQAIRVSPNDGRVCLRGAPDNTWSLGRCTHCRRLYVWKRGLLTLDLVALRCPKDRHLLKRTSREAWGNWYVLPLQALREAAEAAVREYDEYAEQSAQRVEDIARNDALTHGGDGYRTALARDGAERDKARADKARASVAKIVAAEKAL